MNLKKEILTIRSDTKDVGRKLDVEQQKSTNLQVLISELKSSLKKEAEKQSKLHESDVLKKDLQKKVIFACCCYLFTNFTYL